MIEDINSKYTLNVVSENTNCQWCLRFKKTYLISDLLPQGICLSAFHAIYPYYLTLTNGGWFKWVMPGDGVIVQCPSPEGALEMKVYKDISNNEVRVEVLQTRGYCPKEHKKGDVFILRPEKFSFCPKALDAIIPYLNLVLNGEALPWKK